MPSATRLGSSFRDPSGFVFKEAGVIYREVGRSYADDYEKLKASGLFLELTEQKIFLPFEEVSDVRSSADAHQVLKPVQLELVTYPYEWCFGQLKDAALLTLQAMSVAMQKGFVLKDATAFNVQFYAGRPVLIDTLSLEPYVEGEPWIAYRQFCRHFLAPLALMAYVDPRLISLFRIHIDGVPLDLAAKLLPSKAKLNLGLAAHLFMHAKADGEQKGNASAKVSKTAVLALIDSLKRLITGLDWQPGGTEWSDYYSDTNYSQAGEVSKRQIVEAFLQQSFGPDKTCWDLGANNGEFSQLALRAGFKTVAWDIDHGAVEQAYRWGKKTNAASFLPLVQDLANPSPGLGWNLEERDSFTDRGNADVLMALALIHHLAIGNNVPLGMIAQFFSSLGANLIIEFVPKEDSQVQRILVARKDVFDDYHSEGFEREFGRFFEIVEKRPVQDTARTLYLLRRRD